MGKKNLILGGVLIIMVVLAYLYQGPFKKWQASSNRPVNFLASVDISKVDRIVIGGEKEVTLQKGGDGWLVAGGKGFKADSAAVSSALGKINEAGAAQLELVSTNKGRKANFKTDGSGIQARLYEGEKEVVALNLGKASNDFITSYVGRAGDDNTYQFAGVNLYSVFSLADWRDKEDRDRLDKNIEQLK